MVWRGDIVEHYNNATNAYKLLEIVDLDDISLRDGIREIIVKEMRLACKCVIDWLDDENNQNSINASSFIDKFELGYDICVVIEARTFIYNLLGKSLYELVNMN